MKLLFKFDAIGHPLRYESSGAGSGLQYKKSCVLYFYNPDTGLLNDL